ncbi:LPXTG cell wall anchor domain-containing protein, partial [Dellaglioa algida]|uniref:LPXTG cell wall anchor domain-containing protein n=2 Tax=Dellaglioa TaxID=2767880 RepID=UPI0024C4C1C9
QTVTYVYVKDSNSQESEKPTIPVIPKNPNDQGTTENMKQTNKQGIIVNSGDQKNKELPQTDEMNSTWLVILGGFLLVASFGLIDLKKRKD